MSEEMWTILTIGPVPETQRSEVQEVINDLRGKLGGFDGEIEENPNGEKVTFHVGIGSLNYGAGNFDEGLGAVAMLIEHGIPYRISDDGGHYQPASEYVWQPEFGEKPLPRSAIEENWVAMGADTFEALRQKDPAETVRLIEGWLSDDPTNPDLADARKVLIEKNATKN